MYGVCNTAFPFFYLLSVVIDLSIESLNWKRGGGEGEKKWQQQRDSFVSTQRDSWWVLMISVVNFDARELRYF